MRALPVWSTLPPTLDCIMRDALNKGMRYKQDVRISLRDYSMLYVCIVMFLELIYYIHTTRRPPLVSAQPPVLH